MTCEISIMNLQAIALAADSSMTVSQWVNGKEEKRFFKGTNKIFQLSNHQPVGLMIFGTASLQDVPWELIVKEFRVSLGDKSFNDLSGYATELFDFIKAHGHLFPNTYQQKLFKRDAYKAAMIYLFILAANQPSVKTANDDAQRRAAYQAYFDTQMAALNQMALASGLKPEDLDSALAGHLNEIAGDLQTMLANSKMDNIVNSTQLATLAIKGLFKRYPDFMNGTGVVVAGFGDNDYFPCLYEYRCFGLLLGNFLFTHIGSERVDTDTPSQIKPFATTDMVNTFLTGFSPDVYAEATKAHDSSIRAFADAIKGELGVADIPKLDAHIQTATQKFNATWIDAAFSAHFSPLTRVIGSLPVDEMASLAETLIMLQSLKEKVTQPTESVGGPIDVAVITKGDGFIWIKRKHYFEPALNPRFFVRQQRQQT